MREFASLAAEVAEYEAFERFRRGRASGPPATAHRATRLAAALKADLVNTAVLVAAATSLANALEDGAALASAPQALTVFLPAPSSRLSAAVERLLAEDIDASACEALQAYAARLHLARRLSRAFVAGADAASAGRPVDADVLADAWRRTCAALGDAISALNALAASSGTCSDASETVLALLDQAGSGGSPCVDPDGRVTIPGWAERRRDARYDLQRPAVASRDGTSTPVTIRDLSASGIGLEVPEGAKPGDRLTLRLPSGREISGTVAWAGGQRAGIKLDRRLPDDDPLFFAARDPAKTNSGGIE